MEEESLKQSIETYKLQLSQVSQAIQAAGPTEDLLTLQRDLEELVKLSEESLLSLKKSHLLKQLDVGNNDDAQAATPTLAAPPTGPTHTEQVMDDEYAAFQAMLGEDNLTSSTEDNTTSGSASNSHQSGGTTSSADVPDIPEMYQEIIGTKCRAPFLPDWGGKTYGNAMIAAVEIGSELEIPKICVMFCNPTQAAMLPCPYFLEGNCKFTDDNCRYSHGYKVELGDLLEYEEPDYSLLKLESRCLARYDDDDLWYKATVVDLHDDLVSVTFDSYNTEVVTLALEDVWPLDHREESSDDDDAGSSHGDDRDDQPISIQDSEEEEELPVFLWKPPSQGLGDLGQWEAHTKGIGSRLMCKMGYEPGKGLGRSGEGRIEPVPIQLLPQGKSLDVIMQLKEMAGERNVFDVVKKLEKSKKKHDEKLAAGYQKAAATPDVFDFINKKLGGKKGKLSELVHKHEGQGHSLQKKKGQGQTRRNISEQELNKKSDRSINIQLLKTGEEIKSVQKELAKLRKSLSRNESRDRAMAAQVRQKIQSLENYLERLQSSETAMTSHQKKRSDHKKLTVF